MHVHHHFFVFNTSNDIRKVSPIAQSKLYLYLATISISYLVELLLFCERLVVDVSR
jgi:hypothetical protein